jgi:2'-5' RNA ligase
MVGYVILLSNDVHNYMRRLQVVNINLYGTISGLVEAPHITIKQGFEVEALEPFEQYFDKLASEIRPFEIIVRGIGFFDQGIIFLDIEQDSRLKSLRTRVLRDLSNQFNVGPNALEDDRYHFHATLAHGLSKEDFANARQVLKDTKFEFRFVFDTLGMFYYTGEAWIVYKRLGVA